MESHDRSAQGADAHTGGGRGAAGFDLEGTGARRLGGGAALVCDGALGASRATALAELLASLEPRLGPAHVGRERHHVDAVRGDRTVWLDRSPEGPLLALWDFVDDVRRALREHCLLSTDGAEVQYALYPGGGALYRRHRDAFAGRGRRRATLIWYPNRAWAPSHGGALRVHEPDGPRDIEPSFDRAVLFLAERLEHEVLPAHAPRAAATAWLLGPA
jgi:SM-20-related protein